MLDANVVIWLHAGPAPHWGDALRHALGEDAHATALGTVAGRRDRAIEDGCGAVLQSSAGNSRMVTVRRTRT